MFPCSFLRYLCPHLPIGRNSLYCRRARCRGYPLQPAQPLNLADLPLNLSGYLLKFAFGSQRRIRTNLAGHFPDRTAYSVKDSSRLVPCAEFHDTPPLASHNAISPSEEAVLPATALFTTTSRRGFPASASRQARSFPAQLRGVPGYCLTSLPALGLCSCFRDTGAF